MIRKRLDCDRCGLTTTVEVEDHEEFDDLTYVHDSVDECLLAIGTAMQGVIDRMNDHKL